LLSDAGSLYIDLTVHGEAGNSNQPDVGEAVGRNPGQADQIGAHDADRRAYVLAGLETRGGAGLEGGDAGAVDPACTSTSRSATK
jgi:hypothetical protein